MERYSNKRMMFRQRGKFRKATPADLGIGGVCPICRSLLLRYYDGARNDPNPDPRRFRYRCFTCEPDETGSEDSRSEASQSSDKARLA